MRGEACSQTHQASEVCLSFHQMLTVGLHFLLVTRGPLQHIVEKWRWSRVVTPEPPPAPKARTPGADLLSCCKILPLAGQQALS